MGMSHEAFLSALSRAVPADRIKAGDQVPIGVGHDWSTEPYCSPLAWVAPRSTEEVMAALAVCHRFGIGVVPQGGLTGLSGGANTWHDQVALSLSAMNVIEHIDAVSGVAQVQAGVILQTLQEKLRAQDLVFSVDLGPRGSCQIGGLIATNAGGTGVIQYGTTRAQVLGLEVVLADGALLPMLRALPKNNSAYDLNHLFVGSEGTLGVITRAILRVVAAPSARQTVLLAIADFTTALQILQHLQAHFPHRLAAFELMWSDYVAAVLTASSVQFPFTPVPPLTALIEFTGQSAHTLEEEVESALGESFEQGSIIDAVFAASSSQAAQLWQLRESVPELFARRAPINFDLSLPLARGGDFVEHCRNELLARWPGCDPLFFGHLGDGNLHIIADARGLPAGASAHDLSEHVYGLLPQYGGAVSAEHGIGSLRRAQLKYCRSPAEVALMRTLKTALDPMNILNPGKVLAQP